MPASPAPNVTPSTSVPGAPAAPSGRYTCTASPLLERPGIDWNQTKPCAGTDVVSVPSARWTRAEKSVAEAGPPLSPCSQPVMSTGASPVFVSSTVSRDGAGSLSDETSLISIFAQLGSGVKVPPPVPVPVPVPPWPARATNTPGEPGSAPLGAAHEPSASPTVENRHVAWSLAPSAAAVSGTAVLPCVRSAEV